MRRKNDIVIKVLSLGVGLAIGIVLIAKVFFELSFDRTYKDIDRTYIIRTWASQPGGEADFGQVSGAVAVGFMNEVPGVETGTRVTQVWNSDTFLDENNNKLEAMLLCADTCFFKVFDQKVLVGDPVKTLGKWGSVMVSRSFAEKLVGRKGNVLDAVGKHIANEEEPSLMLPIEGVFEDFPKNGSMRADILLSMVSYPKSSTENWLGNDRYKGFVKLYEGVDPHGLKDAIRKMQEAHQPFDMLEKSGVELRYYLSPLSKMHTSDPAVRAQVVLLSIVAVLLIAISLLNYILIVISSMVKRSKEVGVRKCYGAESKHIYGMLAKEASLHLLLSLILAAAIIFAGRGIVENLLGVPFSTLLVPQSVIAIAAVLLGVLVVSIVVPAELYQRIPVYAALKNYTENSRRWKLGLLGVQVFINVLLVAMMLVIGRQYEKVMSSDPGYDSKDLFYITMKRRDLQAQERAMQALQALPEVSGVAASNYIPIDGSPGDNVYLMNDDRELFNFADQYSSTTNYFELMGIEFAEGHAPADSTEMVVDERFAAKLIEFAGWTDGVVGKQVRVTGHETSIDYDNLSVFTIAGVYKTYVIGNFQDMDSRPSAVFFGATGDRRYWMRKVVFRTSGESLPKVKKALEEALEDSSVDIVSYEDAMRADYDDCKKIRNTVVLGVVFSLLIALLGLIGFISDESLRRSKEMAIRKINGAVTRDVLAIFASDILKLGAAMALLACVAAFFLARKWLEQFAEKVALSPAIFFIAVLAVLLIVLAVVVLNSLRIAHANPVDSLKSE